MDQELVNEFESIYVGCSARYVVQINGTDVNSYSIEYVEWLEETVKELRKLNK